MTRQEAIKLDKRHRAFSKLYNRKVQKFIANNQLEELAQWRLSQEWELLNAKLTAMENQMWTTIRL